MKIAKIVFFLRCNLFWGYLRLHITPFHIGNSTWKTFVVITSGGCCNIWYLPETRLKFKSCEISWDHWDHFVYAPSQWETTSQCNSVFIGWGHTQIDPFDPWISLFHDIHFLRKFVLKIGQCTIVSLSYSVHNLKTIEWLRIMLSTTWYVQWLFDNYINEW